MTSLTHPELAEIKTKAKEIERTNKANEVDFRNKVNAKADEVQTKLIDLFRPFVGKKIRTVSGYGDWSAPVKKVLDPYLKSVRDSGYRVIWRYSCGSLFFEIDRTYKHKEINYKGWESDHAVYVKEEFYVGRWEEENGNLREVSQNDVDYKRRKNWTVEELQETRNKIRTLENELSNLKGSIRSFRR